ncbi:MAG: hypothetical protein ACKVRP_03050 [Bacteroidota bacterium]
MGLYSHLSTPIPTIAYCAIHQALPSVPKDEYIKTMKELHRRIAEEAAAIESGYEKAMRETIQRQSQMVRNSLSPFLQTPLHGDKDEVTAIIGDSLDKIKGQLLEGTTPGLSYSYEGRIFFPTSRRSMEKKLLKHGKDHLAGLDLSMKDGAPDTFESVFVVRGGMNLDVLEYIVRDKLGIYATTHGKHIKEFGGYSYAAYNRVYARGEVPAQQSMSGYLEMAVFFSKPDVKYAPFRSALTGALDKLLAAIPIESVSVWQRKLGLGRGTEFVLRLVSNQPEALSECLEWIAAYEEQPHVADALTTQGSLVVKELLF